MASIRHIYTIFIFFLLTIVFSGCEKEADQPQPRSTFKVTTLTALPPAIQSEITKAGTALKATGAYKNDTSFGSPLASKVHQCTTENGAASYTLALSRSGEGLYYDNLVINKDPEGNLTTRIIRYRPHPSWYAARKAGKAGYDTYSGSICLFTYNGQEISSVNMLSGIPVASSATKSADLKSGGCEIIDVQEAGLLQNGVFYLYEIIITVDCSGSGGIGGGNDGLENDLGNGGGQGGGGSPGGGGSAPNGPGEPVETVPVEEENSVEDIIVDPDFLNDFPCQAQIVYETYGICSPLTQVILDLFEMNNGTNLIYIHSNTLYSNGSTTPNSQLNTSCANHTCDIIVRLEASYLETATDISIARTVIHESLHAILVYMAEEGLLSELPNDPDFSDLATAHINYLSGLPSNLGQTHHELMASFVGDIATSLSQYGQQNGYNLSYQFYNDMAWGGLTHRVVRDNQGTIVYDTNGNPTFEETPWFQSAVPDPAERDRIINRLAAEAENKASGSETPIGQPCIN